MYYNFNWSLTSLYTFVNTNKAVYYVYMLRERLIHIKYCIKGNVNVCLIFPNLPNGFEMGTIKTLSFIIFVGMVAQTMHVFRLSSKAVNSSYSLSQQMAPYVI